MKGSDPGDLMDLLDQILMAILDWVIGLLIDIRCDIGPCGA